MKYTVFIEQSGSDQWIRHSRVPKGTVDWLIEHARKSRSVSMIQVWNLTTVSVVYQATRSYRRKYLDQEINECDPVQMAEVIPLRKDDLDPDDLVLDQENEKHSGGC